MALKNLWSKTIRWFSGSQSEGYLDGQYGAVDAANSGNYIGESGVAAGGWQAIYDKAGGTKAVSLRPDVDSAVKQQDSFNKLIDKLQGINDSLQNQLALNEELVNKMSKFPELVEHIAENSLRNDEFQNIIKEIPVAVAKQNETLVEMNQNISDSAQSSAKMVGNFNKFTQALNDLNQSTQCHKDSILQMSKTFETSDRYLKYLITKQNKRFMWAFLIAMGVCFFAIVALLIIIINVT